MEARQRQGGGKVQAKQEHGRQGEDKLKHATSGNGAHKPSHNVNLHDGSCASSYSKRRRRSADKRLPVPLEPWCVDFLHFEAYGGIRCHWHSVRTPWVRPPGRQQGLRANAPTRVVPARLQVGLFLYQYYVDLPGLSAPGLPPAALPLCKRKVLEVIHEVCTTGWILTCWIRRVEGNSRF